MIFDRKRKAWGAVAVGSAGALLVLGSALPASASSSTTAADPIQTYEPDTSLVSASEQAEAESVVAVFVAENPVPEHTPGSSDSDFAAYNDELETYWNTVPWESVMEQWGCTLTETPTVSVQTTGFGTETVVLEEGHICGDNAIAAPAAGIVESRSVILDDEGIAFADSTLPSDGGVSTQGTGYGTNVTLLSTPTENRTINAD
ncbi:hypothetical protein E3N86_05535 [Cryobacterium sp. Hz7]|uniref:Uncharacterized protein n=1 Tax=Cryobacterium sandaracinum TaxID=1259247 RepID=A0ABY2J4P0_9MICO|nr:MULTISPECIES: hypothetical protein [Cryobacterium]TFB63082.1 hypothetical protein E3N86_05535 [Cryobacterium sp. Hz7]TFC99909.1 hypothetical protein E3T25_14035 [Cryobacterium sandaracinum]